ncbi:MAG: hypothetical protein HGB15_04115 [Chlorobaculum sp.]|nr:hypothetical protein [Chlorobaculum sp.]
MKKLSVLSGILLMTAAFPLSAYSTVPAPAPSPLVFTLDEYTGDNSQVIMSVTGSGTHSVTVDVSLGAGTVADIRGIYFSWDGNLTGLSVSGPKVTSSVFNNAGGVDTLPKSKDANMHGDGNIYSFDGGVEIGKPGIGKGDDIQSTSFTLTANENITFTDLGARLQSVYNGTGTDGREGSSKLYVKVDTGTGDLGGEGGVDGPIPEPASVALIGIGAILARAVQGRLLRV